jgi:hypothetical protein
MKDNTQLKYNGFAIEQARRVIGSASRALVRDKREIECLQREGCASLDDLDQLEDIKDELAVYAALMLRLDEMADETREDGDTVC